jgi:hypothetical protein
LTGARVEQAKITPASTSMSFVAEGEAKTNELTVAGQGELLLFAESSDEHFTATIEGTTLTVTAAENTTTEAKSATVTVYMAASADAEAVASAEIACSQAAPSTGDEGDEPTTPTEKSYVKVTSAADITAGQYLIVYEEGALALNGSLAKIDAEGNGSAVTIADGKIASTADVDKMSFTFAVVDGGFSILAKNGKYIGSTASKNELKENTAALVNVITFQAAGDVHIVGTAGSVLRYNNAATNGTRFRYYKSTSYTSQQPIHLYKLVE